MGFGEGVEGCYKCMKYVLVIFNFLVLLVGGAVVGLGIFLVVSDYGVTEMAAILGSDLYSAGVYLMIVTGAVTFLISFAGCCGACMESRCLLGLYFGVMLILTVIFLAVCIMGFVFRSNITGHLKREAETTLINKYGSDPDVTDQWDTVQKELKCCGVYGDMHSNTSWAIYKLESFWFKDQTATVKQFVPSSCCDPAGKMEECMGTENTHNRPPKYGPPVDALDDNPFLYTHGCYEELEDFLSRNALIIGGIALGALFIMVLGVIFSICVCCAVSNRGYVV